MPIKNDMNRSIRTSVMIIALLGTGAWLYSAFAPYSSGEAILRQLQQESLQLQVPPLLQQQVTSCGESAITMAYNYAHPQAPIQEYEVIAYATEMGYFTVDQPPFTSPADMVKIARHYTPEVATGRVFTERQGLILLARKLRADEPVIIDVLTRLNDPTSSAHFVVVTGLSADPGNAIMVHYNNPLTGMSESAPWAGTAGIWNAWQNNGDPGGAGWWMTFRTSP